MKRTTRSQLREGDRPWGGRLWESHQPTNRNLIRGRRDGTSWHNTAKFPHSVPEVNEAVGWRRFSSLPGEISTTCDRTSGSGARSNARADGREVSSVPFVALAKKGGHSTEIGNRGDERCPINCETRKLDHGKDRTNIGEPTCAPSRLPTRQRIPKRSDTAEPDVGGINSNRRRAL